MPQRVDKAFNRLPMKVSVLYSDVAPSDPGTSQESQLNGSWNGGLVSIYEFRCGDEGGAGASGGSRITDSLGRTAVRSKMVRKHAMVI